MQQKKLISNAKNINALLGGRRDVAVVVAVEVDATVVSVESNKLGKNNKF